MTLTGNARVRRQADELAVARFLDDARDNYRDADAGVCPAEIRLRLSRMAAVT